MILPLNTVLAAGIHDFSDISHWKCDESSGVRYDANTTSANDLTDNNTVASALGLSSDACDFEATNLEYLSHADNGLLSDTDSFTLNWWVKFESLPSSGQAMYFLTKWDGTGSERSYVTYLYNNSGTYQFSLELRNSANSETQLLNNWAPSTATWYMITVIYDSALQEAKLYINGTQQGSTASSMVSNIKDSTVAFRIGSTVNVNQYYMDGLIDEASIFDSALSAANITTLYNSGSPLSYLDSGSGSSTTTATSTDPYTDDVVFMLSVIVFFLASIWIGFVASIFWKTT